MEEKEAFGDLIKQGVIMKCPECGICLERADSGCQMLRCFYCRLDICWLTKQARWGPGGKGIDKENRKEGLFPSNFVTADLEFEDERCGMYNKNF